MNMYKLSVLSLSSLGSFILFLVGEWNYLLMALVALVAVDYVTGTVAAFIDKSLSSKVGFRGIAKKVFIFALVMMANFMDRV
ncbi:phage holin family protein, partial [Limosilactobacillus reuteri]|uniref:phage holin family protein n=1 Tax=Limosilactobacillus reuteri TaxID=1598 RepID=UPI0011467F1C